MATEAAASKESFALQHVGDLSEIPLSFQSAVWMQGTDMTDRRIKYGWLGGIGFSVHGAEQLLQSDDEVATNAVLLGCMGVQYAQSSRLLGRADRRVTAYRKQSFDVYRGEHALPKATPLRLTHIAAWLSRSGVVRPLVRSATTLDTLKPKPHAMLHTIGNDEQAEYYASVRSVPTINRRHREMLYVPLAMPNVSASVFLHELACLYPTAQL